MPKTRIFSRKHHTSYNQKQSTAWEHYLLIVYRRRTKTKQSSSAQNSWNFCPRVHFADKMRTSQSQVPFKNSNRNAVPVLNLFLLPLFCGRSGSFLLLLFRNYKKCAFLTISTIQILSSSKFDKNLLSNATQSYSWYGTGKFLIILMRLSWYCNLFFVH